LIFTLGRSYGYLHRFTVMPVRNTGHVFRRVPGSAVRILIGAALLGGSVTAYGFFMSAHPGLWNHSDEYIYWAAGRMVRANPAAVYHVLYGGPREYKLPFTYPPFAAWAFSAVAGVSFNTLQVALVALNISLLPVITFLSMRLAGHRAARSVAAALAIAAISVWLEPVYSTLFFGQINLILLALILADFAIPATCRWKGCLIGIAAGIKLTPLIFVPYLAATRRLRAAAVSLLAFAATVGIGFLTLPAGSREYWTSRVFAGPGGAQNLANQSINGVIQRLVDTPSLASTTWAVLAVLTAAAGIGLAAIACRRGLELAGIVICALTGLLVSPISWTHHWVWVVPGLTLLLAGTRPATAATPATPATPALVCTPDPVARKRTLAVAGIRLAAVAAIVGLFTNWPRHIAALGGAWTPSGLLRLVPHGNSVEDNWRGTQLIIGNAYVLFGFLTLLATTIYFCVTRRSAAAAPKQERAYRGPVGSGIASPS
jgi:alpha-1,2-mannosyltransferase